MEVSGQHHARLHYPPPGQSGHSTHWTGGWVGQRAGVIFSEKVNSANSKSSEITEGKSE